MTNAAYAEVYRADDGFRWRAVAGNGEIVAEGESHPREQDAARAARSVLGADIVIHRAERGSNGTD